MKKTIITILLAAMLTGTLASCGGATAETETASTADTTAETETETELTDNLPETDMGGYTLSIYNYNENWLTWTNTRIVVPELTGDVLNDALYNRQANIEERFNCKILTDEADVTIDLLKANTTAGDATYSVYAVDEGNALGALPYIAKWDDIPYLQLDQPWWNPDATKVYNILNKQIALAGNISLSAVSRAVCMVFNKNIYNEYFAGEESLYDIVTANEWTVDKYLEITDTVHADLNGDGAYDVNDLYGLNMGRGFKGYIASFLCGSGMNFTTADADGNQSFTLHQNEKGIGLMQKLVDKLGTQGYYYNEDKSVHGFQPTDFFSSGHALFTQGVPNDIYKLRDMEDDIGIVPMPKYDASQEKYTAAAWGGATHMLARTFDMADAENLGIILEAMSFSGFYDVIPQYKEIALKTKTARDSESADMLDIIFSSIYFDFGTNILYDGVLAESFLADIWNKKSSDVIVSSMEKHLNKIEKYIADLNEMIAEIEYTSPKREESYHEKTARLYARHRHRRLADQLQAHGLPARAPPERRDHRRPGAFCHLHHRSGRGQYCHLRRGPHPAGL